MTDLFLTLGEKADRVCTVRDGRTDDWEPVENGRWLSSLAWKDLVAKVI
jgi:hypothetical protein